MQVIPAINSDIPYVSIGMPVFNGASFIREVLDSLLSQTFTNFELIISDNASTDCTQVICREYEEKDRRVQYIRQSANLGALENFRYVLEVAEHDRFIWAAADDQWDTDRLELLVANLFPEDAAVIGNIEKVIAEETISEFVPISFKQNDWWSYLMREESRCEKVYYIYGLLWKDIALKAFLGLEDQYWVDAILCYRLLWMGNLRSISGARLNVRVHTQSTGTTTSAGFTYSIPRFIYRAHPWEYYKSYLSSSPDQKKLFVMCAIPIKAVISQIHLWFRAFKRLVLKKPYMHGAVAGGERTILKAGM